MLFYPLPSTKVKGTPPPPMWRCREGLRMKSNLQGRRNDRKGGLSPPPNTAKLPAGAAVRWSYPRKEFVNCKTDKTDAIVIDRRIGCSSRVRGSSMRGVVFLLGLTAAVIS